MKCQILFSGKNKKNYTKMSSAEIFTQSAKRLTNEERHVEMCFRAYSGSEHPNKPVLCSFTGLSGSSQFLYAPKTHLTMSLVV